MTQDKFISWLEGYLDGKEFVENPALDKIREKFKSIQPSTSLSGGYPTHYTVTTSGTGNTTLGKQLLTENED